MSDSLKKILAYTVAFDSPGFGTYRQMAQLLSLSVARASLDGDFFIIHNAAEPFFLVERKGIHEISLDVQVPDDDQELARIGNSWKFKARDLFSAAQLAEYHAVMFLDADCIALRSLEHLVEGDDWDVVYQPEVGRSIQDPVFNSYLTEAELGSLTFGINAGSWAVRSALFKDVMAEWESITNSRPIRRQDWRDQTAWNKLIYCASSKRDWRVKPFEAHEIQFPLHLDLDWKLYRHAAVLHCLGVNTIDKLRYMFGMYMQTYYWDLQGTIVNILDM